MDGERIRERALPHDAGRCSCCTTPPAWPIAIWPRRETNEHAFLASSVDPLPLSDIASGFSAEPRYVDEIEWFASPDDVCRTFAGLQVLSAEPALSPTLSTVLSREVGGIGLDPSEWPTVWFKGGSEPGVLTLGWLATNSDGETFVVEAMVSNPDAALSEDSITDLVALARGSLRPPRLGWSVSHDVVLAGGRVVDPETGFDRVCDVGIDGDSVTAVGDRLDGATTVDVRGLVVAPGFVDLHSHAQTLPGRRLQACDGVTTALDLEAGRSPVEIAYAREAKRGSPINYGFSASWAAARMHVMADGPLDGGAAAVFGGLVGTDWQQAATAAQVARILDQISTDLAAGAVGIGVLVGYAPGVDPAEYLAVAELAAAAGVPTFTHSRDIVELAPETLDRRRGGDRPGGRHDRRAHALLPHQLDVGAPHRSSAGAGRPLPGGRRPRHDRGVPVRVGIDGDRRCVPRAGAVA